MTTPSCERNTARLSDGIDVMPREAHAEHISMLYTERGIDHEWTTLQKSTAGLDQRRIDLIVFTGLLDNTIQTWSGRSTAMGTSQEVLRMAAQANEGSEDCVGYVKDCMTSERTQKMTEGARSAFVDRLQGLKAEADKLLDQMA